MNNNYVVVNSDGLVMKVKNNEALFTFFDMREHNTYPSKYAAKKHLRTLANVPSDVKIIELVKE